jgi:hypothetical protein
MHHTLCRDHVVLLLVVVLVVALLPAGSLAPLAEAGLYIAPLALFVGSLSIVERLEARGAE